MPTPRDFTPDDPFFQRIEELQGRVAAGEITVKMAAAQLLADGFDVEFTAARTLMIGSVDVAAEATTTRFAGAKANVLRKFAVDLSQEHGLNIEPAQFAERVSELMCERERGVRTFGEVTQAFFQEYGLPAEVAIDTMLAVHEMYRAEMLSGVGLGFTCNQVNDALWAAGSGVISY